jgi:hypothetical protein
MKKPNLMYMSPQDEGELVTQDRYLAEILAWAQAEYQGIKITLDHIKKLLQMVQKDQYPGDSVPDEVVLIYEKLAGDYEYAQELAADMEQPAEEIEVQAVSQQSQQSAALVESVNNGIELSSFTQKFDLGEGMTHCIPKGNVTMEDWVGAFGFGLALESGAQWIVGDSVVALEDAGHEDVVNQLCAKFKKAYSTVSGYARACREFTADKRDPMLPFTVYRELGNAKLDGGKRDALLDEAKNEHLSSTEVRNRVREEQGKNIDKPAPHRYLVLNVSNFSNSEIVTEVPDKLEPHHLLIDLLGKKWFDLGNEEYINFIKGK